MTPQTPLRPGGATPAGGGTPRLLDVCSCAGIGAFIGEALMSHLLAAVAP